jgi:ABC-type transport system involved in multi-copper enzyme maturation permease subunit
MLGIPQYLWRLVPANPILLRVVGVGGKRRKDLVARCAYLGLLIVVILAMLLGSDASLSGDLDELTRLSSTLFVNLSYLQLALVALLAPIFTAGAITQEKDSQTYDILLSTPLTNGQIVLGTLLSRLFFVLALLLSGIPVFGITQIFGGVGIGEIVYSALIAGVTALLTGALATAVATFKVGTRRTIFSFYMLIAVYLVGGYLLDAGIGGTHPAILDPATGTFAGRANTSWLTGLNPLLALQSILEPIDHGPPALTELPPGLRGWFVSWYLTKPAEAYVVGGTVVSLLMIVPSIVLLRKMAQSTLTPIGWLTKKLEFLPGVRPPGARAPRSVWNNPIAWREAKTKASAARAGLLRWLFVAAGVGGAIILCVLHATSVGEPRTYVDANSYNAASNTIFIGGEGGGVFQLPADAEVQINDRTVRPDEINRRLVISQPPTIAVVEGAQTVTTLDMVDVPRRLSADGARTLLLGMVFLEVAVILLIVTNAAASTVTREREDGSLDLLLSTPVTSRYYIWGKLRGLVSFAAPLLLVPTASCLVFVLYDAVWGSGRWLVLPESIILVPILLVVLVAFASIVGMNMSLRTRTTVRSVMISLGIVIGLFALLGWCGTAAAEGGQAGLAVAAFSPLSVIMIMIDPIRFGGEAFFRIADAGAARVILALFAVVAAGAYAAGVWGLYTSMVKNFDMTIRKQQR